MAGSSPLVAPTEPPAEQRFTRNRATRGKGLRKKTGCLTCRRRHVRCNEAKPVCGGCVRRKCECVYETQDQPPVFRVPTGPAAATSPTPATATATVINISSPSNETTDTEPPIVVVTSRRDDEEASSVTRGPIQNTQNALNLSAAPSEDRELTSTYLQTQVPLSRSGVENARNHTETIGSETNNTTEDSGAGAVASGNPEQPVGGGAHIGQTITSSLKDHRHVDYDSRAAPPPCPQSAYTSLSGFAPGSISSTSHTVETPTARWLELLIGDAVLGNESLNDIGLECNALNTFGSTVAQTPVSLGVEEQRTPMFSIEVDTDSATSRTLHASLQERLPYMGTDQVSEKQAWYSTEPLKLSQEEFRLFHHFVQHISQWIDLFEPKKPFGTFVPHLAMHNFGLMNAILALSARHLSLNTNNSCRKPELSPPNTNDAVRYYYKTLHYSQEAMKYETYKVSLELLAISIIISTYEMLDGSSKDWERHLKGVFWIQRSQVIHGDSGGLRQGVWWAWLCQDVWAAFREERKPLTFWWPTRSFDLLDPSELAARSVHLFAQVLSFCSREEWEENPNDFAARVSQADNLVEKWSDWRQHLTVEFEALPVMPNSEGAFAPIWIHPPAFSVALQLYHCALILISLHRPRAGGIDTYLEQKAILKQGIMMVCGIASALTDFASGIMSSQCVFIAGMSVEDVTQRTAVLKLLDDCRTRTGWPVRSLGDEISLIWQRYDKSTQ
ncbi:fungal-specific transcription factor domain-containing protein [Dactylonectria macrodidyma]|uniref:Fungal-specific transcription factor domain-containing protein n=1 Tax=Dactylonectria macrodidyma TaxID=307937 RepID=A0A9P9FLM3_9HYPO|nr:fungal-specific transcription factor domain-containing protein [Dactylonectria macrodidyma]